MEPSQSLLELIATAKEKAKTTEVRISELLQGMNSQAGSNDQGKDLRAATASLELLAVDTFSVFEARMQHHFKRGPFSRKLKSRLLEANQTDLAARLHNYYLAINVLKHGTGASYRELLKTPDAPFVVKPAEDSRKEDADRAEGLIDVRVAGFFDGLVATILEAYHFLENTKAS